MPDIRIRKMLLIAEDTHHDGGPPVAVPHRRAAALAVIANPFAGRHAADLQSFAEALKPLALEMSERLVAALGGDPGHIQSYGKGAVVGIAGEVEHGAMWHVPGGYGMRAILGVARAIVPSAMKIGVAGTRLDVPLGHINAAYVRSHFDAIEVSVPDAPRPDEIVYVLAMTDSGRVHARMGGLTVDQVRGEDGLR